MAKIKKITIADVPTLKKGAKIEEAASLLLKSQAGCVVIVENNAPIGIVTELDIVRDLASNGRDLKRLVSGIMSSPVTFMTPKMKLDEALKIIDTKRFRMYPAVENGKLVGLATKKDVVHAVSDNVRMHRNIQNIVLIVFVLFEFFVFVLFRYLHQYLSPGA